MPSSSDKEAAMLFPCSDAGHTCVSSVASNVMTPLWGRSLSTDTTALINQHQDKTGWYQMEDVNYVLPPSIASRKPTPLHRDKLSAVGEVSLPWHSFVARQLSKKEVASNQKNIDALDKAWIKLIDRRVWGLNTEEGEVREYDSVRTQVVRLNKQVHFGRTFGFVVIKQSELKAIFWLPKRRVVFIGNTVADQSGFAALFSEQRSSSSHLTAVNLLDAIGHMPEMKIENADAIGAYTQNPMEGDQHVETWIIIEPEVIARLVANGKLHKS